MPEIMIFKEVIDQNGVPFTAFLRGEGSHVSGKWTPGVPSEVPMIGIILPVVAGSKSIGEELSYIENGVYTLKEKKLFTTTPIELGVQVKYKNDFYTVQAFKDFSEFTDVFIYLMKWREGVGKID